jgi:hypothetical protein
MTPTLQELYDTLVQAREAIKKAELACVKAHEAVQTTPEWKEINRLQAELSAMQGGLANTPEAKKLDEAVKAKGDAGTIEYEADLALRAAAVEHYNATKEKSPIKGVSVQVRKREIKVSVPQDEYLAWAQKSLPSAVVTTIDKEKVETAILKEIVARPDWLTIIEHPTASITLPK